MAARAEGGIILDWMVGWDRRGGGICMDGYESEDYFLTLDCRLIKEIQETVIGTIRI